MNNINIFYFIKDKYFLKFQDKYLMKNKEIDKDGKHGRPCYFAFCDSKNQDIYWLIPISSKIEKFENLYKKIIEKRGTCDTIAFGYVLGKKKAFLIQNMCPATKDYLEQYIDSKNNPISMNMKEANIITKKAKIALAKYKKGLKTIFPDVIKIYSQLEKELQIKK